MHYIKHIAREISRANLARLHSIEIRVGPLCMFKNLELFWFFQNIVAIWLKESLPCWHGAHFELVVLLPALLSNWGNDSLSQMATIFWKNQNSSSFKDAGGPDPNLNWVQMRKIIFSFSKQAPKTARCFHAVVKHFYQCEIGTRKFTRSLKFAPLRGRVLILFYGTRPLGSREYTARPGHSASLPLW